MIDEHIHNYDIFVIPCHFSSCNELFLNWPITKRIKILGHSPNKCLHFQNKSKISIEGATKIRRLIIIYMLLFQIIFNKCVAIKVKYILGC